MTAGAAMRGRTPAISFTSFAMTLLGVGLVISSKARTQAEAFQESSQEQPKEVRLHLRDFSDYPSRSTVEIDGVSVAQTLNRPGGAVSVGVRAGQELMFDQNDRRVGQSEKLVNLDDPRSSMV